jgi:general secretion pathway protein G
MTRLFAMRRALVAWDSNPAWSSWRLSPGIGIPGYKRQGFTLVEIFMVIAIMGILAGLVIPSLTPDVNTRLSAAADIVVADLAWARSLAVANNTNYTVTTDTTNNLYYIEHTGANSLFNSLPESPWGDYADATTRRTTRLAKLPGFGPPARLAIAQKTFTSGSPQEVTSVEFGPLGQTTRSETTVIWLAAGLSRAARYLPLTIDPITGLVTIGDITDTSPIATQPASASAGG